LPLPLVALIAVLVFIPMFRQGRRTTAFEYLGLRYGPIPRLYGTVSFLITEIIRAAQVLFLLSLPIQALTDAPSTTVILATGLVVACYTILGGMEGIIWIEVLQTLIMLLGGLICLAVVAAALPGGIGQVIDVGSSQNKFSMGSLDWDLSERTFWTVFLLGIVNWLAIYGGDQNIVQRYLAAKSTREARKATIIYTAIALPLWALFFFVGTGVFVFYQTFPDSYVANLEADRVFPHFIVTQVPAGLTGLIVTAIVAAAMSTLDASINSISTVSVVDVGKQFFFRGRSDQFYLRMARICTAVAAALMIGGALLIGATPKESINHFSLMVASIFGGCLMGLFMLGFFAERVDGVSATLALAIVIPLNIYLGLSSLGAVPERYALGIHSYWVGFLVNLAFVVLAYGISLLRPVRRLAPAGLTVWTMRPER
jgi:SSS family solute:Na+ symporter